MLVFKNPQRQWLAAAEQELAQWCQQRAIIDNRIVELQATIQALTPVVQRSEQTINLSVPQLCLKILSLSAAFHSPTQIRDGLTNWGIQINSPNPMAVIHTALGRLVQSGYVEAKSAGSAAVIFKPSATGIRSGSVSVVDALSNSPQTVGLAGLGVPTT
jgi:hypothetical protein